MFDGVVLLIYVSRLIIPKKVGKPYRRRGYIDVPLTVVTVEERKKADEQHLLLLPSSNLS